MACRSHGLQVCLCSTADRFLEGYIAEAGLAPTQQSITGAEALLRTVHCLHGGLQKREPLQCTMTQADLALLQCPAALDACQDQPSMKKRSDRVCNLSTLCPLKNNHISNHITHSSCTHKVVKATLTTSQVGSCCEPVGTVYASTAHLLRLTHLVLTDQWP